MHESTAAPVAGALEVSATCHEHLKAEVKEAENWTKPLAFKDKMLTAKFLEISGATLSLTIIVEFTGTLTIPKLVLNKTVVLVSAMS